MKTNFFVGLVVLTFSMFFTSCNNDVDNPEAVVSANEKFTYSTTKTIQLEVSVNDTYNDEYYYKVEVFDRNPFSTDTVANLLTAGVAKGTSSLKTNLVIPQHISQIYIRQTDPLKRKTVKIVELSSGSDSFSCNFKSYSTSVAAVKAAKVVATPDPKAVDYELPASYTTLTSSSVTLNGISYYVPSGVTNSGIDFGWKSNSALYVAGTVIINAKKFYMPSNCKLVVLPGGSVTFDTKADFEQTGIIVAVHPQGSLIFNNVSSVGNGSFLVNDGNTYFNDDFEIRSNAKIINNGTLVGTELTQTNNSELVNNSEMKFSTNFIMNSNTKFRNEGTFEVAGTIETDNVTAIITNNHYMKTSDFDMSNGGGVLNNNCKVECTDMSLGGATVNCSAGTLVTCNNLYVNKSTVTLSGNAMFMTGVSINDEVGKLTEGVTFNYNAVINGQNDGTGNPLFSVKKLNQKTGWKVLSLQGDLEYSLASGETPNSNYYLSIGSNVSIVEIPTVSISGNDCNNGGVNADNGSGSPESPEFPMLVTENNEYTFAMEDLWPNLGDYDMNDFVFTIHNITKTINSENKVLEMSFDILPRAAGSTKELSAVLQFDNISSGELSLSSTGSIGSIENGQTEANILLFPSVHSLFGKSSPVVINTFSNANKVETQNYTFTVSFANPVSNEDVIISKMNFYIIVGDASGNDRNEVHLAGFKPSSKVQKETNNYKDSNNMVWAIMLPVGDFKYPTESVKIYEAYPQFKVWAASAGTTDTDWYLYPTTGLVYLK